MQDFGKEGTGLELGRRFREKWMSSSVSASHG